MGGEWNLSPVVVALLELLYGVEKTRELLEQAAAGVVKGVEGVAAWCARQKTDDRWDERWNPPA